MRILNVTPVLCALLGFSTTVGAGGLASPEAMTAARVLEALPEEAKVVGTALEAPSAHVIPPLEAPTAHVIPAAQIAVESTAHVIPAAQIPVESTAHVIAPLQVLPKEAIQVLPEEAKVVGTALEAPTAHAIPAATPPKERGGFLRHAGRRLGGMLSTLNPLSYFS